jgi:small subunit ribosomal protein S20
LRTAIKKIIKAVEAGDKTAAVAVYSENVSVIDRIADKNIIHKNKASRHKSRLNAAIKEMAGTAAPVAKKAAKPAVTPKAKAVPRDKAE